MRKPRRARGRHPLPAFLAVLSQVGYINEEHGILSAQQIKDAVQKVSAQHKVSFVILFSQAADQSITLVGIGPFRNLANFLF